ncbi:cytidylyltransferase domain-containing protein [Pantoea sp. FN0305]|uniref:acylneuraminate cytidylyltransferase family protein n=1 Tax=Pantoea sp. FN0305 TaxID=3418559 RepID=UPI003CF45578
MKGNIAIIPARGGSKRLQGKNIRLLNNKPLIAWTIEAAKKSGIFDNIIVSTDCENIATIARYHGAEVPFLRPSHLATDEATTNDVITHLVENIEAAGERINLITLLQPTSPLRTAQHILEAAAVFREKRARTVISVCKISHPIQLCNKLPSNLSLDGFIKPDYTKRSQEQEIYYRINGAIYIFDRAFVGKLNELYTQGSFAYIMDEYDSVDIDTELDFKLAEILIKKNDNF